MKDQAWTTFSQVLTRELGRPPRLTSAELAYRLGVDEEMVANWRRGRSRPALSMLRRIVSEVNRDRHCDKVDSFTIRSLLREMGVLEADVKDADLIDKALRLQKLELKLDDARIASALVGRQAGASTIVHSAIESARWSVAVWPAYEGPSAEYRLHVADRIDLARIDGSAAELTVEDVWNDPQMKAALRATRAVPSSTSPRWAGATTLPVSQWSILHVGSPRDPLVDSPWPGLGSLCFVSVTLDSWVNDVAALVALAIGYGLSSTRDLAMDVYGLSYGRSRPEHRWVIHERLLASPPSRRVWSHYGPLGGTQGSPFGEGAPLAGVSPLFVFLDEEEELIYESHERWKTSPVTPSIDEYLRSRDGYQKLTLAMPSENLIKLPTRYFADRGARWEQALNHTLEVLKGLESRGVKFDPSDLKRVTQVGSRREPAVVTPLVNWLADHGWPDRNRDANV